MPVGDARYPQFCPVARATEIIGERWNLLIIRQLTMGAHRFSDLRRSLAGISPSVLSERLTALESLAIIRRTQITKPVPGVVYELDEAGRAFEPVMRELMRWGARFLYPPRPDDRLDPEWFEWFLMQHRRDSASPQCSIELHMLDGDREHCIRVEGGPDGTRMSNESAAADVTVRGDSMSVAGVCTGYVSAGDAVASGSVTLEGSAEALDRFFELFELG
jgi:DNA-binding HxlR family transcriptional regulator